VYHLGFGESRFPVHPKILEAFRRHATAREYPPVAGYPALRATIAAFYEREFGIVAEPEQVIVGPGSKSLIFAAIQALAGDLLLPRPSWVSYEPHARLAGKSVTWIDTALEEEYCITASALRRGFEEARQAGQNPRILVINTPGNPTGVAYPRHVLTEVAEVARAHELAVISDEIYALLSFSTIRPHYSIALDYPESTIVTGGLSKHLSLGGWRFGLAVLPPGEKGRALLWALSSVAGHIWSSPAAPVQHAAIVAYGDDPGIMTYVRTCTALHESVTRALYEQLQYAAIPCPPPSGGYYLYPSFDPWRDALRDRHGVATSDDLASLLLEEFGIATLPGTAFGAPPDDLSLRLATCYLYTPDDSAMDTILEMFVASSTPTAFVEAHCPALSEV
ncbi:MAG: pyridoxal phosphate-dependent aminotransferase, partial [Ardenticatenaceae bacterium]